LMLLIMGRGSDILTSSLKRGQYADKTEKCHNN
jgi:hypothetical protein